MKITLVAIMLAIASVLPVNTVDQVEDGNEHLQVSSNYQACAELSRDGGNAEMAVVFQQAAEVMADGEAIPERERSIHVISCLMLWPMAQKDVGLCTSPNWRLSASCLTTFPDPIERSYPRG